MKIEVSGRLVKKLKGLEEYSDLNSKELTESVSDLVEELLEEYIEEASEDDDLFLNDKEENDDE
jgi:hypothetical protein